MSKLQQIVKAMQESPAWPAVFDAGSAETLARAALAALREPDDGMVAAMGKAFDRHNKRQASARDDVAAWRDECERVEFTAAIDHVLGAA